MTTATARRLYDRLQCAVAARDIRERLQDVRLQTAERVRETTARLEQSHHVLATSALPMKRWVASDKAPVEVSTTTSASEMLAIMEKVQAVHVAHRDRLLLEMGHVRPQRAATLMEPRRSFTASLAAI
jgi:hypothetical protein